MRTWILAVSAAALLAGGQAWAQEAVRIGTSSVGSVFYTLAVGAGEVIGKHTNINATAEPVGGSAANVNGLGAKKIEFAVANSFASYSGYHGTYRFKKPIDLRVVMQGQASFRYLFARKGSGIKSPRDLEGKTIVAKRRSLPELELIMNAITKHFNLRKGSMNLVATTTSGETIKAIRAGSVDAILMPFSRRSAQIEQPMRDGVMEFIQISKADQAAILKMLPSNFFPASLKPNNFSGQAKAVHLFALNTYFITRPDIPDNIVYQVAKAIMDNNKEFATYHGAARQWTAKRAVKNIALPFHPGAIRYFKEKGLWNAEMDRIQAEVMKR